VSVETDDKTAVQSIWNELPQDSVIKAMLHKSQSLRSCSTRLGH